MPGSILEDYWIGGTYESGFEDVRTLIIGDSHYSSDPITERSDLTETVVRDHLNTRRYPFFNAIERIITGLSIDMGGGRDSFWDRVCFANFVTEVLPENGRATKEQYAASLPRFRHIIETSKPQLVCFFSAASWDWRPWGPPPWLEAFGSEPLHVGGSYEITDYQTTYGRCTMSRFNHPRNPGAPFDVWHTWFRHVHRLAAAKDRPIGHVPFDA